MFNKKYEQEGLKPTNVVLNGKHLYDWATIILHSIMCHGDEHLLS